MLPPLSMLTIKNPAGCDGGSSRQSASDEAFAARRFFGWLVLGALVLAGCAPPGPRALLEGKRLIERQKYAQAVEKLKLATSLLKTNAQAWNYLGLGCQHAGQEADAASAYLRALALNHDLPEAHYNLGCLYLGQNKLDSAKLQFTAYTLLRGNAAEGFLKLGTVQMRLRELSAADKSFSDALRLEPKNAEALNNLGVVRQLRGRPNDALQCFNGALKLQSNYAPALLNCAIVAQQTPNRRPVALQRYREYLALRPLPEKADAVLETVRQLEQEEARPRGVTTNAPAPPVNPPASTIPPKPPGSNTVRASAAQKLEAVPEPVRTTLAPEVVRVTPAPRPEGSLPARQPPPPAASPPVVLAKSTPSATPAPSPPPVNVETVRLSPEPVFKAAQDVAPSIRAAPTLPAITNPAPVGQASASKAPKRSLLQRINPANLFRSDEPPAAKPTPSQSGAGLAASPSPPATQGGLESGTLATPSGDAATARYAYKSPRKPSAGNRSQAERPFAEGCQAQQAHRLADAVAAYRAAARLDPSYYEAHFNLALTATEAGDLPAALAAYEMALATRPDSLDARYNFAFTLKQAGYLLDAGHELEKLLAKFPNDTRGHLALANLCAQQLHQPAKARAHYLRVLEIDPRHPQAESIRYWITANPA